LITILLPDFVSIRRYTLKSYRSLTMSFYHLFLTWDYNIIAYYCTTTLYANGGCDLRVPGVVKSISNDTTERNRNQCSLRHGMAQNTVTGTTVHEYRMQHNIIIPSFTSKTPWAIPRATSRATLFTHDALLQVYWNTYLHILHHTTAKVMLTRPK
jgi:hypothetical protein